MRRTVLLLRVATLAIACSALSTPILAQTQQGRSQAEMRALWEQHKGDFDYLLGDWEFTASSREYPKFRGRWSATKLAESNQIMDEFRITGDSGETYHVSTTLRSYDVNLDRWELISTGQRRGLRDFGTGRREGSEMHIEQRFDVGTPNEALWRIRYYDIGPDHFSWSADRSTDGGKTWISPYQTIEAKRIGPARSMAPLTKPEN